jgi:hypothetical protein
MLEHTEIIVILLVLWLMYFVCIYLILMMRSMCF